MNEQERLTSEVNPTNFTYTQGDFDDNDLEEVRDCVSESEAELKKLLSDESDSQSQDGLDEAITMADLYR